MSKAQEYLNSIINYGGIPARRKDVIADMLLKGATIQQVNLWFAGYESTHNAGQGTTGGVRLCQRKGRRRG
jgi:hypothetical protein